MSDKAKRCEPPAELRDKAGWHCLTWHGSDPIRAWWVPLSGDGAEIVFQWNNLPLFNRSELADEAYAIGYRYLMPCPDPVELLALVKAARRIGDMNYDGRPFDDCDCDECKALRALTTALAAPSIKGIGDE